MFTALIGPLFVDWTSYRESFEREASAYIGRPVTVAGKAGVRLLPTPVVSFTNIRVGDGDVPDVEMERFRAEIELAPLLKGEVRVIQMAVERPRFNIDIAALLNGGAPERQWKLDPQRISLERLQIIDGSALVADSRTGRSWEVEGLNAEVEADTLRGPGRVTASLVFDGNPTELTANLGQLTPEDSITAKIAVRSPDYPVSLSVDGTYYFPGANPLIYEGFGTIEGVTSADASAVRSPWADFRASGKFKLAPSDVSFDEVQVSYGAIERPLVLVAAGAFDFGRDPSFDLTVEARQIDVDRTLGGGAEQPIAIEAAVAALVNALPGLKLPPVPGELHLEAQGVVLGGGVLEGVEVDLSTAADGWVIDGLSATVPGETRFDLSGTLTVASSTAFRGQARLDSERPAGFAAWWRGEVGSATQIGRFAVDTALDLTASNLKLSDLVVTTGAGTVTGSVDARRFPQSDEFLATVDLSAGRADLVEMRAIVELLSSRTVAIDQIQQMTVSLRADVLTAGGVEARDVAISGTLDKGLLNLADLSVADVAGARLQVSGDILDPFGSPSGKIEASVEAADLQGAADFLASFAPESNIARRLKAVAPIISPVNADVSAEGGAAGEKLALSITGSFADTHLTLAADGRGSLTDLKSLAGTVELQIDGSDSAGVLRQLGLSPLAVRSSPLNIDASFDGQLASGGRLALKGTVAGIAFDYAAQTTLEDERVALAGEFKGSSDDIDPALLLAGLGLPGVGEGHAASASGRLDYSSDTLSLVLKEASFADQQVAGELTAKLKPNIALSGALSVEAASLPFLVALAAGTEPGIEAAGWSDTPFAETLPPGTALNLTLSAATLDLGAPLPATSAKLNFVADADELQVDLVEAGFAGGSLTGGLSAGIRDGEADVSFRGGLLGGELQALVWEQSGLPAASGRLDVSFDVSGRGRSVAGIVSTLGGSGSFSIDEGRLNSLNGDALAAVMAAAEGEEQPDEQKARETFAQQFGSGALEFGRAAGSFSILDGVMTIPTVSLTGGATTILAGAYLDLNALSLSSEWVVRSTETGDGEAQPSVQVRFSGPIAEPDRRIELTPLLNLLQNQFRQIQLDKIQEGERRIAEEARVEEARAQVEERQQAEENRQAAADRRDAEQAPTPPKLEAATPSPLLNPALIEVGPDLPPPPPPPVRRRAAPIQLVPQLPPRQASEPPPEYRTLPNGTIVKIR